MLKLALKLVAVAAALVFVIVLTANLAEKPRSPASRIETIYVRNLAPQFESDANIVAAIPAWESAANREFADTWHTSQIRLVFLGRKAAPAGAVTALFVNKGDVKGALAYHTVTDGAPQIVVYAGTDDYYGYSNSVSFTHELFELLADPTVSVANQGWPYDWVWLGETRRQQQLEGTVWIQEVCDPVEADHYVRDGVWISDWITPNWFNDEVRGGYDYMGLVQQPFTILTGGYAQYYDPFLGWQAIFNFRGAGRDADGFYRAEKNGR